LSAVARVERHRGITEEARGWVPVDTAAWASGGDARPCTAKWTSFPGGRDQFEPAVDVDPSMPWIVRKLQGALA